MGKDYKIGRITQLTNDKQPKIDVLKVMVKNAKYFEEKKAKKLTKKLYDLFISISQQEAENWVCTREEIEEKIFNILIGNKDDNK